MFFSLNTNRSIKLALSLLTIVLLFSAVLERQGHAFFTLLKLVVFCSSIYFSWLAYQTKQNFWMARFIIIAFVFNPIIGFHLGKDLWQLLDVVVAIFYIISILRFKINE